MFHQCVQGIPLRPFPLVCWIVFLLLLTTSASTCLQHSRNLGTSLKRFRVYPRKSRSQRFYSVRTNTKCHVLCVVEKEYLPDVRLAICNTSESLSTWKCRKNKCHVINSAGFRNNKETLWNEWNLYHELETWYSGASFLGVLLSGIVVVSVSHNLLIECGQW